MESAVEIGRQLLAVRLDEQYLNILTSQLVEAATTLAESQGWSTLTVKDNSRALLEMCFYIVSLRGWYSPYDISRTPGMLSMNLNCLETASSSSSKSPLLNTSLTAILGCVGLKWTYVRFRRLAIDQGIQKNSLFGGWLWVFLFWFTFYCLCCSRLASC
jgi:hypothetical protein